MKIYTFGIMGNPVMLTLARIENDTAKLEAFRASQEKLGYLWSKEFDTEAEALAAIESVEHGPDFFVLFVEERTIKDDETLAEALKNDSLTKGRKESLKQLLTKGLREKAKNRIRNVIEHTPSAMAHILKYWMLDRLYFMGEQAHYCAGQDYPSELADIKRKLGHS